MESNNQLEEFVVVDHASLTEGAAPVKVITFLYLKEKLPPPENGATGIRIRTISIRNQHGFFCKAHMNYTRRKSVRSSAKPSGNIYG